MKKIIVSFLAIIAVAAVAGTGSYALWSDQEVSAGNSVTADKMDLVVAGTAMTIANVKPGKTGSSSVLTAKNDSATVDGTLTFSVANLVDNENSCPESELSATEGNDQTCTGANGELSSHVKVGISADLDGDGTYETTIAEAYLKTLFDAATSTTIGTIDPGVTANIKITYTVDSSTTAFADNIFMTDSSEFDVNFLLTQN